MEEDHSLDEVQEELVVPVVLVDVAGTLVVVEVLEDQMVGRKAAGTRHQAAEDVVAVGVVVVGWEAVGVVVPAAWEEDHTG